MIPKFRGFRRKTEEWVEGNLIYRENPYLHDIVIPVGDSSTISYAVERDSIGQWTGLKDKNDVEIFDGDIVVASTGYYLNGIFNPMRHYKGVVKFGEYEQNASGGEYSGSKTIGFYGEFSCVNDGDDSYKKLESHDYELEESLLTFGKIEVIGNIYENPELLEVAE